MSAIHSTERRQAKCSRLHMVWHSCFEVLSPALRRGTTP